MIPAINYTDFYKTTHHTMYPKNTTKVYSNFTARISRMEGIDKVVVFGVQYFIKDYLLRRFNESFFKQPKEKVLKQYQRRMDNSLGVGAVNTDHLSALHDFGYLPIELKALAEGSLVPLRIPLLTITNTDDKFPWLPNFLESILSNVIWQPITSATIAFNYRKVLTEYANKTSDMPDFVQWQGHDFSHRGHASFESAIVSGGAHLAAGFTGSDTVSSIDWLEHFYNADSDKELIAGSVPATEHSVMCLGGKDTEIDTYRRLINEVCKSGIVSIVSDTWDYWNLLTVTLPILKSEIMARDGKVVIRPDSGDPVKIICGDAAAPIGSPEYRGSIEILWDLFGGGVNSKGYKQLDSHIGLIYGDSITLERCKQICEQLEAKGFASTNVVFGIGSYTYQYVTRDTFGFAMKATYGVINGEPVEIFKDPLTDGGVKKSAKGLLRVNSDFTLSECVSVEEEKQGLLETVFLDGKLIKDQSLAEIRNRISQELI